MYPMENMFKSWLEQEKSLIKEKSKMFRVMSVLLVVLMIPLILSSLVFLLDGGGIVLAVGMIVQVGCLVAAVFSLSYKRRLIKPLLVSVEKDLPTDAERQEFARQMQSAMLISYAPVPQGQLCEMQAAADYCYFQQPFKSRIIRNRDIKKAIFNVKPDAESKYAEEGSEPTAIEAVPLAATGADATFTPLML